MGRRAVGVVMGAAMVLVVGASDADAYVRYQTGSGIGFAWMPSCLPLAIEVYPGTFSQMTIGEVTSAVTGAAAAWGSGANPCTFIDFGVTVVSGPAPVAANDRRNMVILRDTSWCLLDATGACSPTSTAYDPAALALTTVWARASTGEIIDADIEINAVNNLWADVVAHPELVDRHDLQNVLTHEIGHLLGLDHSCLTSTGGVTRPNEQRGPAGPRLRDRVRVGARHDHVPVRRGRRGRTAHAGTRRLSGRVRAVSRGEHSVPGGCRRRVRVRAARNGWRPGRRR